MPLSIPTIVAIVVAAVIVLWLLSSCIKMVQQTDALIIEFLGSYRSTWKAGLHFKLPFVERIVKRVSLKENVIDFEPQTVITRDKRHGQDPTPWCSTRSPTPSATPYGREQPPGRHREPHGHHAAQRHRRPRARP